MRILYLQPNSGIKFLFKVLGLFLDVVKFIVEKIDSHPRVVSNILKIFPITEFSISL